MLTRQSFSPDEIPEEIAAAILDSDTTAIIASDLQGAPPPKPDFILQNMRAALDTDGYVLNVILAATADLALMSPAPDDLTPSLGALMMLRVSEQIGPLAWIAVGMDIYIREGDAWKVDGVSPAEAFKRGLPGSGEALVAMCVAPDGPGYYVEQRYTRTPEGPIVFAEPEEHTVSPRAGDVLDVLRVAVQA